MKHAIPQHLPDRRVAGSALAARLAGECADLAHAMVAIQGAIGDLMTKGEIDLDPSLVRTLQDIDRVTQTLGDLSRLSAALADPMHEIEIPSDLVKRALRLDSLLDRLIPRDAS